MLDRILRNIEWPWECQGYQRRFRQEGAKSQEWDSVNGEKPVPLGRGAGRGNTRYCLETGKYHCDQGIMRLLSENVTGKERTNWDSKQIVLAPRLLGFFPASRPLHATRLGYWQPLLKLQAHSSLMIVLNYPCQSWLLDLKGHSFSLISYPLL